MPDRLTDPPVFIVGCPRSGTTLLQRMLDAHPDVAVAPETHFVRRFWSRRDAFGDLTDDDALHRLIDAILDTPEVHDMQVDRASFVRRVGDSNRTYGAIFDALLTVFGARHDVARVGEKTPDHVAHLPLLRDWFPNATVVHVVRDPRAVVNSWRSVPWSSGYRWRDAEVWVDYVAAGRQAAATWGDALHVVRFETLVTDPEATLRRLCAAIDLTYDSTMLAFHDREPDRVDVDREPWKQRTTQPVDPSVAHRWRDTLSAHDVAQVEAVARDEMDQWGYRPTSTTAQRGVAHVRRLAERPVWKLRLVARTCLNLTLPG